MAVTANFSPSTLDLNGVIGLSQPTALVWGPDGRLYVTEVDGDVKVLTVEFGDKTPGDGDPTGQFFVTDAVSIGAVKAVPNHADDTGLPVSLNKRQVTGIDVTPQFDAAGEPMTLADGTPMVTMYVTSSDSRIGAGPDGADDGLDTNSGVLTKLTQTGPGSWTAVDLVRGLARSEENHALNGLEVIQTLDGEGRLVAERLIVAVGGNANTGAPSNNFAGQQEQPLSAAILEVDLDMLGAMEVLTDEDTGRPYVYDLPTLDDPTRGGADATDPWGGNDGLNSAKLVAGGPVSIYSPGYRNAYDVEITDDGRVFTYDNGANDTWGGRPVGEAGDDGGSTDFAQAEGYIATNLNNGDGNNNDDINLEDWDPSNKDQLHEITRSDDLGGRALSAGQGGAALYTDADTGLTYVYGGHPNPTRAEGSRAGLLFSPAAGTDDAFLLVSDEDSFGDGNGSDYDEVIAWLAEVEADDAAYPDAGIYGAGAGELTRKVLAVTPGLEHDIYAFSDGSGAAVAAGGAAPAREVDGVQEAGRLLGQGGLPSDIAEIVARVNPIEGNYLEAGKTDGAVDTGNGSINGLTEYTSTVLDGDGVKMSGALIAASLNQGSLIVIGRDADGVVGVKTSKGFSVASDRTVIDAGGAPLGLAAIGDDYVERGLSKAFQGSIWTAVYKQNGPLIEIHQPVADGVPLAGTELRDPTDHDGDGVDHIADPFEFSAENGYALGVDQSLVLDFGQLNDSFPTSFSSTGLLGAALDGSTPNQDAQTEAEEYPLDQQRDGLFDSGGNIIPGGNAPQFQVKKVADGTMVGAGNGARDAMHTGFRPGPDVKRVEATLEVKNWVPETVDAAAGQLGPRTGQLTGLYFGDGTQANFLRVVVGGVEGAGPAGLEVGYEIGDADYTVLARVALPVLAQSEGAPDNLDLRLEVAGIGGAFDVSVSYRLDGEAGFTEVALNDGAGFSLPLGVLRDVLTGEHSIGSGPGALPSGAAVGLVAEDVPGVDPDTGQPVPGDLEAIDFNRLTVTGFGNEIEADTAAEVATPGTSGVDTVFYSGSDTALALASDVENFNGRASAADYALSANALGNVIEVGAGANTITTGAGADTVRGTLDQLAGDEITDFSKTDEVIVEGVSVEDAEVSYAAGSAVVTIDGRSITFSGPELASFDPADGPTLFRLEDVPGGMRVTLVPDETILYRVNAGSTGSGAGSGTIAAIDDGPDWLGDADLIGSAGPVALGGTTSNTFSDASTDQEGEISYEDGVDPAVVPWQVFVNERSDNKADGTFLTYDFDVEAGATYRVDLFYTENWSGIFSAPDRNFDVSVEGAVPGAFQDLHPLEEAAAIHGIALGGAVSAQDEATILGTTLARSHTLTAADDTLTLQFQHDGPQNPKINAIQVVQLGKLPTDATAPEIVAISVDNPQNVQDGPRIATVMLSDARGFDEAALKALDGGELAFSGIVPNEVSKPVVALSGDATQATLTYTLTAAEGWPEGEGTITVAPGAYADAAGNTTAGATATFLLQPFLGNLVAGDVALAINVGPAAAAQDGAIAGENKSTYGGAIAGDPIIGVDLQADDPAYYAPSSKTGSNVDGLAGPTGSNPALDGSALHTYRDSAAGSFTATYPIANGIYVVELWFAELFHAAPGQRQGDYAINGEVVALDFDAHAAAGGPDTPVKLTKTVVVTDGQIVVDVNADAGQPGFNAIVAYEAVEATGTPAISVSDASAVEGGEAAVTFTRVGDLSAELEVAFTLAPGSAEAADYGAPQPAAAVFAAGERTATVTIPIADDDAEEGAESFTVAIAPAPGGEYTVAQGTGVVSIGPSDASSGVPTGGAIFALDFETTGGPLVEGGFTGLLGGSGALDAGKTPVIAGGQLRLTTSDGDLFQDGATASKNDFVRAADVSSPAIDELFLTTRFANPFDADPPSFLQQGIAIATGDEGSNQDPGQVVKLIWGGNEGGGVQSAGVQLWSQNLFGPFFTVAAMSAAAKAVGSPTFDVSDVAAVELTLGVSKAVGTVSAYATLFDAAGGVLGGVRPMEAAGFVEVAPQSVPADVLAAIEGGTSVFGVTSSDYDQGAGDAVPGFLASWDSLTLSSPQVSDGPSGDSYAGQVLVDFSESGAEPTDIGTLQAGESVLVASQQGEGEPGGRDYDYVTFTVAEGQTLDAIVLSGFETEGANAGFVALIDAATMPPPPSGDFAEQQAFAAGLLGGALLGGQGGAQEGTDILGETAALNTSLTSGEVQGLATRDFAAPLGAGTYTLWFSQSGAPSTATLTFQTSEAPMATTLSIAPAGSAVEAGGAGTTTALLFPLSTGDDFSGPMTVSFEVGGVTAPDQVVEFTDGAGALSVAVDNDDEDTGPTSVSVTLTGAQAGGEAVALGTATAAGTVAEDDGAPPPAPGEVVFAVNVNGGQVTGTDGTVYEADTASAWTGSDTYTEGGLGQPTVGGGDFDRDGDVDADDTPYLTERWGGGGASPMTYTREGLTPGDYVLTLKLAENFNKNFADGARVFDVSANGVLVVDDLDLFDTGVEVDQAYDVDVPVTVGDDGVLTLSFAAGADNAKVNAIVLREAGPATGPAVTVADAPAVSEAGDSGTATLLFPLSATEGLSGDVAVTFTVDGVAAGSQVVAFAGGEGTLSVAVADDDLASAEPVSVTLTGVSGEGAVLGAAVDATGEVLEDDAAPAKGTDLPAAIVPQNTPFNFTVPAEAFSDADSPSLALDATLADGSPLPAWLAFDGTSFSGTPGPDDATALLIRVTADDGTNPEAESLFTLTVEGGDGTGGNQPPVTSPIEAPAVLETADPVVIDLLQNASDVDGGTLAVEDVAAVDGGGVPVAFTANGDGTITIDPAQLANFIEEGVSETVTITYRVVDGQGGGVDGSATLEIQGVDDALVWYRDADADTYGDPSDSVTAAEQPEGYVERAGDPDDSDPDVYPGAPEINDGVDNDGDGEVDELNTAPVAADDEGFSVASGAAVAIPVADLLGNDADADVATDTLSVASVGPALNGTVALSGGVVTFTPAPGFAGSASFDYVVSDGFGGTDTATVAVEVTPADGVVETPLALDGGAVTSYGVDVGRDGQDRTGPEGIEVSGSDVTLRGNSWKAVALPEPLTIPEGATLRFSYSAAKISEIVGIGLDADDQAENGGTALFQIAGTQNFAIGDQTYRDYTTAGQTMQFEIDLSAFAGQSFDRLVLFHDQDRLPDSSEGTFADIRIAAPPSANTAPAAGDDGATVAQDGALAIDPATLLANDGDEDGDALSVIAVSGAQNGTVDLVQGQVVFTPAPGYSGPASFDYTVADGRGGTDVATVSVTVTPQGASSVPIDFSAAPIQSYDDQDTSPGAGFAVEGGGAAIRLTGNTWKKIALPEGAAIGEDTVLRFDLTLLGSAGEILGIGLETDDAFATPGDALFQLAGSQNFGSEASRAFFGRAGATGEPVSYEIPLGAFAGGGFTHLVVIADADKSAPVDARFADVVLAEPGGGGGAGSGGGGGSASPVILGGALPDLVATEDALLEVELPVTDADTAPSALSYAYTGLPGFVSTEGGVLSGTPGDADVGSYEVGVTVEDPEGNSVAGSFTLTVENVNDAPETVGALQDRSAVLGSQVSIPLPDGVFADADGDALSYEAAGLPAGLTIDPATGAITGQPSAAGTFAVVVTASDGAESATASFELTVADGPPREEVVIEAEDFTGLSSATNFFTEFVSTASGNEVIRLGNGETGSVFADLDPAGVAPGVYDIAVRHYDETDGASSLRVLIDRGDGTGPELLGEFDLDRTDLPGQGSYLQSGNITEAVVRGVMVPAGSRLVLEGTAQGGEFVRTDLVRLTPVDAPADAPPGFVSSASFSVAEGDTAVGAVEAADPEGQDVTYSIAGGVDAAAFAIDAATGALSFLAAPDADAPGDAGANNVYDVTVQASDGALSATQDVQVTVEEGNGAPVGADAQPSGQVGTAFSLSVSDLFTDPDEDALLYSLVDDGGSGLSLSGGVLSGTPAAAGVYAITVRADDGQATDDATITLTVAAESGGANPFGAVAPGDDLDGDGQANAADDDVDGDDVADAADPFAYDAADGRLLAAGESVELTFDVAGTPYENGFTGLLQAGVKGTSALADFDEETGTASVSGGALSIVASDGDTGGSNDPEDDYQLGIRNRAFTVEARVENPFQSGGAQNFAQLGVHVGIDSTDFAKLVFGFAGGAMEFSARTDDAESKATGGNQPLPLGFSEFAAVDLTLAVRAVSASEATLTATATFLDGAGQPIAGATDVGFGSLTVGGKLAAALFDEGVGVGAGVTQTSTGAAGDFVANYQSFEVTADDPDAATGGGDDGSGDGGDGDGGDGQAPPQNAGEAFAAQGDLFTGASYGQGALGAAKLAVMAGVNDIDASNYKKGSFALTNLGDKKIAAVFIDVTGALYPDSVFDPDGLGGDDAAKPWGIDVEGGTGAYVTGSGYFLPGPDPIPNSGGSGGPSNGGFRGAMVKFTPGDFEKGETVGFSGDMDPNSIAGMGKNGPASILAGAVKNWDVGGISGHEMIGSSFTVLFDDGTTATGELMSDGSASGSHTLATQAGGSAAPTLTVNGVAGGGTGTYGVTAPTVVVTGEPGDTVRVTLTKGFDPVTNTTNGVAQLVEDRLSVHDFEASNNFDSQSVDVVIGQDGRADLSDRFDYAVAPANEKGGFPGDDTAPIGFVAAVVDPATGLPASAVTEPVYLTNQGGPVTGNGGSSGGDSGGSGGGGEVDGYWLAADGELKVQFESILGETPPQGWTYQAPGQGNSGAQGAHYFWGEEASDDSNASQPNQGVFGTTFYVEEAGTYTLRVRAARDTNNPSDRRNDIFVRIDEDTEALVPTGTDPLENEDGFVKLFGASTAWGYSARFDDTTDAQNPLARVNLSEGFHTIEFAGRSQGYHIDFFELSKGGTLVGQPDSAFVEGSDPPDDGNTGGGDTGGGTDGSGTGGDGSGGDTGGDGSDGGGTDGGDSGGGSDGDTGGGDAGGGDTGGQQGELAIPVDASSDDWEIFGGANKSKDLEFAFNGATPQTVGIRFDDVSIPAGAVVESAFIRFQASDTDGAPASFVIEIEDTEGAATYSKGSDPDSRSYAEEDVAWSDVGAWTAGGTYESADVSALIEAVIGPDGISDGALAFRISGAPGNGGGRAAHSWDSSSGSEPVLVINLDPDSLL